MKTKIKKLQILSIVLIFTLFIGSIPITVLAETLDNIWSIIVIEVESIEIIEIPKQKFIAGYEYDIFYSHCFDGMKVKVTYNDDTVEICNYEDGSLKSEYNSSYLDFSGECINEYGTMAPVLGENIITVTCDEKTTELTVIGIEAKKIEITKLPNQLDYIVDASSDIKLDGMEIRIDYNDGSSKCYSFNGEVWPFVEIGFPTKNIIKKTLCGEYSLEYPDIHLGKNKVIIMDYYNKGVTAEFEINGIDSPVDKLEVVKLPDKVLTEKFINDYSEDDFPGFYEFYKKASISENMHGAELKVYYKDGATEILKFDGKSIYNSFANSELGLCFYRASKNPINRIEVFDGYNYETTLTFMGKSTVFIPKHINKTPKMGDIDGKGDINIEDATMIQKYIVSLVEFNDLRLMTADTNGDGRVNIEDVTIIQKFIAEIITSIG